LFTRGSITALSSLLGCQPIIGDASNLFSTRLLVWYSDVDYDHFSDAHSVLFWLRIQERADFKLAVMAFRALHGLAPSYSSHLV
jgi:hypothetical protein